MGFGLWWWRGRLAGKNVNKAKCPKGFDLYAFFNRSYYDMITVRCRGEDQCDCKERDFDTLADAKAEYEKDGKVLEVEYGKHHK